MIKNHNLCVSTSLSQLRLLRGDEPTEQLLRAAKDASSPAPREPVRLHPPSKRVIQKGGYVRWPNYPWGQNAFAGRGQNWVREDTLATRDTGDRFNLPDDEPRTIITTCIGMRAAHTYIKEWGNGCYCVFTTELLSPRATETGFWTIVPHAEVGAALSVLSDTL